MQLWLSKQIARLSLTPSLLLTAFILFSLVVSYRLLGAAALTEVEGKLAVLTNSVITELQKERGISAGFLSSKGTSFKLELSEQRRKVDSAIAKVNAFEHSGTIPNIEDKLFTKFDQQVSQIQTLRNKVDRLNIAASDAVVAYSLFTSLLIDFNGSLVGTSENALGKQKFVLLYKLSVLQENAGLERALLNSVFATGTITDAQSLRFRNLLSTQQSLLHDLKQLSTDEFRASLDKFLSSQIEQNISAYREIVLNGGAGPFNTNSEEWFSAATQRIGGILTMTGELFEQLQLHADEEYSFAYAVVLLDSVLLAITLILAGATTKVLQIRKNQSNELQSKLKLISKEFDLTQRIQKISNDDLGDVTDLTNALIQDFKNELSGFQTAANEISASSKETANYSAQTNQNVKHQQKSISASLESAETLNLGIKEDLESMSQLTDYARASAKMVDEGEQAVSAAVSGIRSTAEDVKKVGETIEVLNTRVDDIVRMVDVIRSVAEQTNLLALNAAIEAARAGEQGRGFAVVADEVRALAKRTQDSTVEISRVVDDLNESSSLAFSAIASGADSAGNAVNMADKINQVLRDVAQNMRNLEGLIEGVDQSAKRQSQSLMDMTNSVRSVDTVSEENSQSSEQVASAASNLASVAEAMLTNIKRYTVN